ncbi:MAG: RluA family pseudouridine synthase [Spirochaetota bacterium]
MNTIDTRILYEDNHIIAVNKLPGEIVQGDESGDRPLSDAVKEYLKATYRKPGNVFLGIPHRLDRPTSGVVLFARTDKALSRLGNMFREKRIKKVYWAVVKDMPPAASGELKHYLVRNRVKNKSFAYTKSRKGAQFAHLSYRLAGATQNYYLLEIELHTGRHHQIRSQLAAVGSPVKGDLKYGAPRSNKDGGISLHARKVSFEHPVTKQETIITAQPPADPLWDYFSQLNTTTA